MAALSLSGCLIISAGVVCMSGGLAAPLVAATMFGGGLTGGMNGISQLRNDEEEFKVGSFMA